MRDEPRYCFLCGVSSYIEVPYLNLKSENLYRNAAYLLPIWIGKFLSYMSKEFGRKYRPVLINRKYFNRNIYYCKNCNTGACQPGFSSEELNSYYSNFYWEHRDTVEGRHIASANRPNDEQIRISLDRIEWISKSNIQACRAAIDFGAGDCAGAWLLADQFNDMVISVVDPSEQARANSKRYGFKSFTCIRDVAPVDLIFSAHSIEHVEDLMATLSSMVDRTNPGGYIFLETPNISNENVFLSMVHTPHTYMLSSESLNVVARVFNLDIIKLEAVGPMWRKAISRVTSDDRADLRVLFRKPD